MTGISIGAFTKMKRYELIYLDADDTLFDYKTAEREGITRAFRSHGIACSDDIIGKYAEINEQLWAKFEKNEIDQVLLRTERFRLLFAELGLHIDENEFSGEYLEHLGNSGALLDGAKDICVYLHGKYKTAIVTNGIGGVQRGRLLQSKIKDDIDYLIISEEAGINKPNPGIFEYAEKITGFTDKSKMIIIGDSLTSDIRGGMNYGIDTCWYNPAGKTLVDGVKPTYEIADLDELKGIL